jgi:hypothetical protein
MKSAGLVALLLAVILWGWAAKDYAHHQHDRQSNVSRTNTEISGEPSGSISLEMDLERGQKIDDDERYDALIGIVGFCALTGSISLFLADKP